jgi:hypothetical protein
MTQSRVCVYSPVQIAECGGPCEQGGPECCDCGALEAIPKPPPGWLPIETAPAVRLPFKMFVVIAMGVKVTESSPPYTSDPYCVWRESDGSLARWPHPFEPTHWLPLPHYEP